MLIAYEMLFSVTVNHLYFPDKVFENFEFTPNKKTADLINEYKLVTKKKANGWNLFFQTEGPFATTPAALAGKEFLFELKITSPDFFSITDEDYLHGADEMLFFSSPINPDIIPEKRALYPLTFNYAIHHLARPVNVKLTTVKGVELINKTLMDPTVKELGMNLTEAGENSYNIAEDTVPPSSAETEKIFAKEKMDAEPFYGIVYLKVLPPNGNPEANVYEINFEANH